MLSTKKYYGEVWFPEQSENRCFCVLSFQEGDILLETNLCVLNPVFKQLEIQGEFTELAYVTFIDCKIRKSLSGLTEMRVYCPRYSFIGSQHPIKAFGLKFKKIQISNDAIVDWVNHMTWYNTCEEKIIKKEDIHQETTIETLGLKIGIHHSLNISSRRRELSIANYGFISFEMDKPISVLYAIKLYNNFQKVLQFLSSHTEQFKDFKFQCLFCGEWAEIYYNDYKYSRSNNSYIRLTFDEIRNDLPHILQAVYTDMNFQFCLDKLMENLLNRHTSHNKRFTNSISTLEAFGKLYSGKKENNLKRYLEHFSNDFMVIGKIESKEFNYFAQKIVRSRDYHIHSNLRNKDIFSEFELLYISFLIDFVVGYGLLVSLGVSDTVKKKIISQGQSVYINMKNTNLILSSNPLASEQE